MSTFVKIKALRQSLSSSEAKLADFTLNSANAIRNLSSVELAKVVGVSQSSVVKFSQKLGSLLSSLRASITASLKAGNLSYMARSL
ncbi:MAG: hypothetical protein AAGK05_01385 [Pseudomonadota bacterium]